ncbi:MAG: UDP-N-acetylglucosamine 2-epimerase (non-hydrolyzing) [Candidatus Bathyarchaeota archaeon]|nr:UDP-N-acetylglucosamine 2-epimerase (non-hydrolyzing) [Candidatus Bathyarchaeota archaeon]MDW8040702.1 UDP-N-acetylglucosamine 2-epimerase (non-hydrolyzing) [Nitrososphaerota archaeon]
MKVALVLGARPQIIKSAPFIHLASEDKQVHLDVIHTGQHYDYEMTKIFFEELKLPDPLVNLNVGSGTHAQQTAKVMLRLERILQKQKPNLVVVPGDTNSTIAGALTAAKLHIPVAHMEAGARSYDMKMPEEVNRRLTDHCSTLLFTPTENCTKNLLKEGIAKNKIHQTGDTMYDALIQQMPKAEKSPILEQLGLEPQKYALLTTHRPENVDNPENLRSIVEAITRLNQLTIVFPAHPRTQKQLRKFRLYSAVQKQRHIKMIKPLGYHETVKLIKNSALVLTDSGGMQKEAFWLKTPCITLRETTEWPETVKLGANCLVGANTQRIVHRATEILDKGEEIGEKLENLPNPFGDGKASQKMLDAIKSFAPSLTFTTT